MSPAALQRQAALAGAALLAMLLVVILDRTGDEAPIVGAPPAPQAEWESAAIWITRPENCDASSDASGVVHPVLPCGVKLIVSAHEKELRTEVVGTGPVSAGRTFALTPALADQLGVRDGDRIRWRFAG